MIMKAFFNTSKWYRCGVIRVYIGVYPKIFFWYILKRLKTNDNQAEKGSILVSAECVRFISDYYAEVDLCNTSYLVGVKNNDGVYEG